MATIHNIWGDYLQSPPKNEDTNKNILSFSIANSSPLTKNNRLKNLQKT